MPTQSVGSIRRPQRAGERAMGRVAERGTVLGDTGAQRNELLTAFAHELRSPLNVVLSWAQLLLSGRLDGASSVHALESIRRNAELQERIISDALDLSLARSGRLSLEGRRVDLGPLLMSALEFAMDDASEKQVRLEARRMESGWVMGDPVRLSQVFARLFEWAVDSCARGGAISAGIRRVDGTMEVRLGLEECGVPADVLFGPFRSESDATRWMGLRLACRLVALHGGTMHAGSPESPATLTLRLPRAPGK